MTHRRRTPCCIDEAERFVRSYYGLDHDASVLPEPPGYSHVRRRARSGNDKDTTMMVGSGPRPGAGSVTRDDPNPKDSSGAAQ